MARGQRSVAEPVTQAQRRSNRLNRGLNGRDVQLDRLGEQLTAPTRQKKRTFAPEDGLALENNVLAPPPKKPRRSKASRIAQPQPLATQQPPQPCQPLPNDDRFGFYPPTPTQQVASPFVSTHPNHPPLHQPRASPPPLHFRIPSQPALEHIAESSDSEDEAEESSVEHEIDEQSDDEDNRQTHAFLLASSDPITTVNVSQPLPPTVHSVPAISIPQPLPPTGQDHLGFADFGAEQSVLQIHYDRNRPPRIPVFTSSPTVPRPHQPAPSVDAGPHPRTVESYPPQWQEVIGIAKRSFRAYVAGRCGFPDGVEGVREAKECLEDAVEVHFEGGGTLESGHDINRDMCMIVFGESWQLRSQLKAEIRVQVRNLKSLFPDNVARSSRQPHDIRASIQEQVSSLVSDGSYLHDTIPNSDDQTHFGHPIIASTCKSFYFDRWSDISTFDRDTFQGSVPKPLVALVGAVYRNVLDEWSSGIRSTVKLESKHYGQTYKAILDSMEVVDQDQNYGPLFRERLAAWAGFGESISSLYAVSTNNPITIHLNLRPPGQ